METSNNLTKAYLKGTLKEGDYYFKCGGHIHKGRFFNPMPEIKHAAKAYNMAEPVQTLMTFSSRFIGKLKTVTILAPIPEYEEHISLLEFAKGKNNEAQN